MNKLSEIDFGKNTSIFGVSQNVFFCCFELFDSIDNFAKKWYVSLCIKKKTIFLNACMWWKILFFSKNNFYTSVTNSRKKKQLWNTLVKYWKLLHTMGKKTTKIHQNLTFFKFSYVGNLIFWMKNAARKGKISIFWHS